MSLNHDNIDDEDWALIGWRKLEDAHVDKVWSDGEGIHMLISYPPTGAIPDEWREMVLPAQTEDEVDEMEAVRQMVAERQRYAGTEEDG